MIFCYLEPKKNSQISFDQIFGKGCVPTPSGHEDEQQGNNMMTDYEKVDEDGTKKGGEGTGILMRQKQLMGNNMMATQKKQQGTIR
jgi:hypothetical protein